MASILVVDDSASSRALLVGLLPHGGHRVREASNGAEGLGLAKVEPPDLVIADALMPKMDGYQLVRQLRTDPATANVKVIFYTAAYVEEEVHKLAEGCGVTHVLTKPAEPETILETVEAALAAGEPVAPPMPEADFHTEHLMLLNEKLLAMVRELEAANQERRRLLAYLVRVQEEERRTIAGDIHDDALQGMAVAVMRLDLLGRRLADREQAALIEPATEAIRGGIDRLRKLMFELRPPALDSGGLGAALELYLSHRSPDAGYTYSLTSTIVDEPPDEVRVLLYRIAQEALVNVGKHASATHVAVALDQRDGGFSLSVRDDGVGFAAEQRARSAPGHLGIDSMRERVEMARGRWRLQSRVGSGTTVECWIPAHSPKGPAPAAYTGRQ